MRALQVAIRCRNLNRVDDEVVGFHFFDQFFNSRLHY
jgi:hypothetical protein